VGNSWREKTLSEIGDAMRAGQFSARDLFEQANEAHATYGNTLSAYRTWDQDRARSQAEAADKAFLEGRDSGPLQGIPVSVKDLFGVSYLDTFAGSPNALPEAWSTEGPVVRSISDQGAVVTGKTHMVEFAFGGLGTNAHWPIPRNPWDEENHRVAGGSSSGAGVSLMEGSALVALGSDTAGSVRVPASMTGTVGLKVTAGRWPLDGIVPLSPTFDTPGTLTRSVADAALAFEVIDAHCAARPSRPVAEPADMIGLRIGLCETHFFEECPADIAESVKEAIGELEQMGATVVGFDLPKTQEAYALFRQGSVVSSELRAFLERDLPASIETLDPNITFRLSTALNLESDEIGERRVRIAELSRSATAHMGKVDVLVSPTVPVTAPRLDDVAEPKSYSASNLMALKNTCIANLLGLCAITLPVGLDKAGIPVGLQCMAAGGCEEKLLSIALAFERVLGTPRQRLGKPPIGV